MSGYVLGEAAALDLDEIWEYIARDSVDAADDWVRRLFEAFEVIGRSPGIGHRRTDLTPHRLLFWALGEYFVIYRVVPAGVQIVAVTQGGRDVPRLLARRSS